MRGQTIKYKVNGVPVRRSTKHVKIGRKCFQAHGSKRWEYLMAIAYNKEDA